MRTRRSVALLALTAVALSAPSALASTKRRPAPKPVCNLVTDAPNDSSVMDGAVSPLYDPSLDITSADVASDGKTITAVIRVKQLTASDNMAPSGREWRFGLRAGATSLGFVVYNGPLGTVADNGTPTLDTTHNEIRVSRPVSSLQVPLKSGTVLTAFTASAQMVVQMPSATETSFGNGTAFTGGDEDDAKAAPTVSYKVGTLSCVKPGK